MNDLSGKTVLLISNHGYSKQIEEEIKALGAKCIVMNDKPDDGFIAKALGRLKFRPYINGPLNSYYEHTIEKIQESVDYVLCIRGEYTPESALEKMRRSFPKVKLILYMWDSIKNNRGIEEKWRYYDEVWTFDRNDYSGNSKALKFLPLFYCEKVLPEGFEKAEKKYDLAFIGTGHEDRIAIIKEIEKQCREKGLNFYYYIYIPHVLVYYYNKIMNPYFKRVKRSDVHFGLMPLDKVYRIYSESNCILDVESSSQTGLTMRTIEILGLKKKLLTTNKDIVNYDFYDENNIHVFDRKCGVIDESFFSKRYYDIPADIYKKYSLREWVLTVIH